MTKILSVILSVFAVGATVAATPCVLEKGFTPETNELAGTSEASDLLALLGEVAEEAKQERAAADEKPVPVAVTNVVNEVVTNVVTETVTNVVTETVVETVTNVVAETVTETVTNVVTETVDRTGKRVLTGRPARITSKSTVYNRKEGVACFTGGVHVDDEQYQMHADKVYVFTEGTNDLKRIVALGNVALTNEMRRAYGAKATYSKPNGLVVLYSGDGIVAEVRDESKEKPQSVKGAKIRFWIDAEQVEVLEADISGPAPSAAGGADAMRKALGK